eukprot:307141-Rhodomonas_salina.1
MGWGVVLSVDVNGGSRARESKRESTLEKTGAEAQRAGENERRLHGTRKQRERKSREREKARKRESEKERTRNRERENEKQAVKDSLLAGRAAGVADLALQAEVIRVWPRVAVAHREDLVSVLWVHKHVHRLRPNPDPHATHHTPQTTHHTPHGQSAPTSRQRSSTLRTAPLGHFPTRPLAHSPTRPLAHLSEQTARAACRQEERKRERAGGSEVGSRSRLTFNPGRGYL